MVGPNTMDIKSIRFEGLTMKFEGHDALFENVDFDFPMGKILWLKSDEGAGKSTLLQILAGLQLPTSGKYLLNEMDVTEMSFEEFLPFRLSIGYTFDYGGLISNRTIYDNLMLPLAYHKLVNTQEAVRRVEEIIERFKIQAYANERPAHVPGRVRKMACLFRALVMQPQLLLMDDPSIGLGQDTIYEFVDYIHDLRKQGVLQHILISTYEEKFMNLFDYDVVNLECGQLHLEKIDPERKVLNL